jgi:hypothetical protein
MKRKTFCVNLIRGEHNWSLGERRRITWRVSKKAKIINTPREKSSKIVDDKHDHRNELPNNRQNIKNQRQKKRIRQGMYYGNEIEVEMIDEDNDGNGDS